MNASDLFCANQDPDGSGCAERARIVCTGCNLISYCDPECQEDHWPSHRDDCQSPLSAKEWKPSWAAERRPPVFARSWPGQTSEGRTYIWAKTPAIDVLQLESNEGVNYIGELNLLFGASGDLNNVVKTIAQLPSTFERTINLTINDRDPDIVARNVIILLMAVMAENINQVVDSMIHVWYSAFLRPSDYSLLQTVVRPLLESVYEATKDEAPTTYLGKTWRSGTRSVRVVLHKRSWDRLLSYLDVPEGLTYDLADQLRQETTTHRSKTDLHHLYLLCQARHHRRAIAQYWRDGLLLPFAAPREDFRIPNPTIFQSAHHWPLMYDANPLHGWPSAEIAETSSGLATADLYGKLFYYLRGVFRKFIERLRGPAVTFQLLQFNIADLPGQLGSTRFNRIEASSPYGMNVADLVDNRYFGIKPMLNLMIPLLQPRLVNNHATLITHFETAATEIKRTDKNLELNAVTMELAVMARLVRFLPPAPAPSSFFCPQSIRLSLARQVVSSYDNDVLFNFYLAHFKVLEHAAGVGAAMKDDNTVVEKWPNVLQLLPDQPGAQEEFDRVYSFATNFKECYVEWTRTH